MRNKFKILRKQIANNTKQKNKINAQEKQVVNIKGRDKVKYIQRNNNEYKLQ